MIKKILVVLVFSMIAHTAFAEVQVIDYSTDAKTAKTFAARPEQEFAAAPAPAPIPTVGLSADQRINKLEQQVNNINEQNLINKINELQQRAQKLTGQVEDQKHQIEQLNSQLRSFYQDLNQRIEKSEAPEKPEKPILQNTNAEMVNTSEMVEVLPATTAKNDKAILREQQMYQTAIDLLPDKKYEASGSKLRDYLKLYPKGAYVANAHYWLGEINFLQKKYDAAEEEFKIIIDKYPKSKRVSDAMFKIALVHQNQGRDAQSKQELKQVIKRYPSTSAAELAKLQLEGN